MSRTAGISSIPHSDPLPSAQGEDRGTDICGAQSAADQRILDPVFPSYLSEYLTSAGMPLCQVPIMAEREAVRLEEEAHRQHEELQRQEAQRLERERERAQLLAQRERPRADQADEPATDKKPRWGTPEARHEAMMELQRRIDKSREQSRGGKN